MNKCLINEDTLKLILTSVVDIFCDYLDEEWSIPTLRLTIREYFNEITKNVDSSDIDVIANTIFKVATTYQIPEIDSNYFTLDNIKTKLTAAKAGILNDAEISTEQLTDVETVLRRIEANSSFLDEAFGLAREVKSYMIRQANRNLFDCLFINRGSINSNIGIVRNQEELNKNVREYQEALLKRITDYLNWVLKNFPDNSHSEEILNLLNNPKLYEEVNGKIVNTGILKKLDTLIDKFLSPTRFLESDDLRLLYSNTNDTTKSVAERRRNQLKLDAYNARLLLKHFDTYLSITLGKAIEITSDFNLLSGKDKYKVAGKTALLTSTWRTNDNINPEEEIDTITKMAINTTPLYMYGNPDSPVPNMYLTFSDFLHMIAKLKDLSYNEKTFYITFDKNTDFWNSLSPQTLRFINDKNLSAVINRVRKNPRAYLHSLFEIFSNLYFYDDLKTALFENTFTQEELDKLYSMAIGIFNLTSSNSLNSLSKERADNDFYSYITLVADSIFNIHYILYYKDENGLLLVRTLIDLGINNVRRQIEQTINTVNSRRLIKDWSQFKYDLDLKPVETRGFNNIKPVVIQYTIPHTDIKATVYATSGKVEFDSISNPGEFIAYDELWGNDYVKDFLDKVLRLNIFKNIDLQNALITKFGNINDLSYSLLSFASRVILNQYVSNELIKDKNKDERNAEMNRIYGEKVPRYNNALGEIGLIHNSDVPTLKNIAIAKSNLIGITTASQVKDGEGNGLSNQSLSRLIGSLMSLIELQEKNKDSATRDSLLVNCPGLFEGIYTALEYHDTLGNNKASTEFSVSEMAYAGLVHDFIGGLYNDYNGVLGGGHVMFLPSVNSDKGTIGRIKINLNKVVIGPDGKEVAIKNLNNSQLKELICTELGDIYTRAYQNIDKDFNEKLLPFIRSIFPNFPIFNMLNDFREVNEWWTNINENNEIIFSEDLKKIFGDSPIEFVLNLTKVYNINHRLSPLSLIDLVHFQESKTKKGFLAFNRSFLSQLRRFRPKYIMPNVRGEEYLASELITDTESDTFFATKDIDILKGLIKADFKINTTNTKLPELKKLRELCSSNPNNNWLNYSGDIVLAKYTPVGSTVSVDITSKKDLIRIALQYNIPSTNFNVIINELVKSNPKGITLNPIIQKFNLLHYLFTLEFMIATVGSFIAHPAKGNITSDLEEEAARFLALHKRNVSYTALMHAFLLNLLNGIPEDYNIAVVKDVKDIQGTISGLNNTIKPFDGATFVNPFIVLLENYSLGGASAGITKKLFVHFKDERTGTGGIIKTAGFGLTNDWIRNSPFLYNMMEKMTNHVWLNEDGSPAILDITLDFEENKIKYEGSYFKLGDRYFKIEGIISLGDNRYLRIISEVKKDGSLIKNLTSEDLIELGIRETSTINTNFRLWEFFGGKNSMTLEGTSLKLSNTSVTNTVKAMNNVGTPRVYGRIKTLEDLWQPLKHVDVHYVVTEGAIKLGAANINSAKRYDDNIPLDIQKIHMYLAGILLDKEHHADNADLSLMTLVISACAAKGYTFDLAANLYNTLRTATDISTKDHLETVRALFNDNSEEAIANFLEVLIHSIVKAIGNDLNTNNFAAIVASELIKQAKQGKKINFAESLLPLSDNTIYAKVLSSITTFLTNTGIKLTIKGVLSVLTPSYKAFKLYANRKYESFKDFEKDIEELLKETVPVFDSSYQWTQGLEYFSGLQIVYVEPGSLISKKDGKPVAARNPHDGRILIDLELMKVKFDHKDWRSIRNSKALDYDFKTFDEWMRFVLLHEAMHNIYLQIDGESNFDYETRINELALKRLQNDISNIELGRYYYLTDSNGNIENRLINTPSDYYKLKDQINNGEIVRVEENLKEGRDLSAYNVRFATLDGNRFQLWDLDSAKSLFELNSLRESIKSKRKSYENAVSLELQLAILTEVYNLLDKFSLNVFNIPYVHLEGKSSDEILKGWETRIRRWLQRDLMNLSNSVPSLAELYQLLKDSKEETPEWYNRYAEWVNIQLGRPDRTSIRLAGKLILVNAQNFLYIDLEVSKMLYKATQVRINGQFLEVDKSSIKTLAYELIMPKIFKTKFGLKEFDSLDDIVNNKNFFIERYLENRATKEDIAEENYTLELKVASGDHYYLLEKGASTKGLTKKEGVLVVIEEGKTYRVDINGNILYEMSPNTEIYEGDNGTEVIVTDDLGFYLDELHYDSIKLSDTLLGKPNTVRPLEDIINKSSNKVAKEFSKFVKKIKSAKLNTSEGAGFIASLNLNSITLDNYKLLITVNPNTGEEEFTNPLIKMGRAKHSSFLKSLDVVAARIPAQSMLSFMPMKVVAFDNPDINTAYVSTMQILLLGSDYDIDAVSLATYNIDSNGILKVWSPFANYDTKELLDASMTLPVPTGQEVLFEVVDNIEPFKNFLDKYKYLFSHIGPVINSDGTGTDEVLLMLKNKTVQDIALLKEFLEDIQQLQVPRVHQYLNTALELENIGIFGLRINHIASLISKLKKIADTHNLYFDTLHKNQLSTIINNLIMYSMYNAITDPVNLILAHTSVDGTTGPLKETANNNRDEIELAKNRTPGNFVNLYESIIENQVGKDGIGICAVGLKTFFALLQYNNYILNYGTAEQQSRLLLGQYHLGIELKSIKDKKSVFEIIANIRAKDPNTITNDDVLHALASTTNDNDAALILSALLSLATDNAKELTLSKLNAGTKMIGMYIYGVTIGMEFLDIAKILMSESGTMINSLLNDDIFSGRKGFTNINLLFDYFDKGPKSALQQFNITKDENGNKFSSPLLYFEKEFKTKLNWFRDTHGVPFSLDTPLVDYLISLYKSSIPLAEKIKIIENFRNRYETSVPYAKEVYNLLIDFVEDFVQLGHTLNANPNIYKDIKTLAKGAEEMRRLGLILGLNLGIKNTSEDLVYLINALERSIYDITGDLKDLIDLTKFVFDELYRLSCIKKYETVKHSINILDTVSTVPHFMGYLLTLAIAYKEVQQSFKFRSIKALTLPISKDLNIWDEKNINKGLKNYIGDYLRKQWMLDRQKTIIIPSNNIIYSPGSRTPYISETSTPVELGLDSADVSFRIWMENEVIPNLKQGIVDPDVKAIEDIYNNDFVKDLSNDLLTNTVSKNPSIIYTLPINMSPRTDSERTILDKYKAQFNELAEYDYYYYVDSYDELGVMKLEKISIPVLDLFIYYTIITHRNLPGEKSLVPILEDFMSTGILKDFHDFEGGLDLSGETINNISLDEVIPYIIPFESPYSSYAQYIYSKNPNTDKYEIMRKLSRKELESMDNEYYGVVNGYIYEDAFIDTNYFPTGLNKELTQLTVRRNIKNGDKTVELKITYNIDSKELSDIKCSALEEKYLNIIKKEFNNKIPIIIKNGTKRADIDLIEAVVKYYINPSRINITSIQYLTLYELSGISSIILSAMCQKYLEEYGRYPYLDELPNSDSSKYIREKIKIKEDGSTTIKNILDFTGASTLKEAIITINNSFRDSEINIIPINEEALVEILHRPTMAEEIQDRIVSDENVSSYIVLLNSLLKLAKLYGITFNTVSDAELNSDRWKELMPRTKQVNAFIYDGLIYLNMDRASVDAPLHEMMHLFVGSMRFTNPELYYNLTLLSELLPNYNKLLGLYSGKTRNDINEEIFITEVSKYLTGLDSALTGIDLRVIHEIAYNIHRMLDTVLMGTRTSSSISENRLYDLSLKSLANELNSTIMTSNIAPLGDTKLHRQLNNMKADLIQTNKLKEFCD